MKEADKELCERIMRYLDGSMTPDEEKALAQELKAGADSRRLFAELSVLYGNIESVLSETDTMQKASAPGRPGFRWIWPVAVAAGLTVAAGVCWWAVQRVGQQETRVVAKVEESVQCSVFSVQEEGRRDLKVGDELCYGAKLETGDGGWIKFVYLNEKTSVILEGKSRLTIGKTVSGPDSAAGFSSSKHLQLSAGSLVADVAAQPGKHPMIVVTPHAEMTVRGTMFTVAVSEKRTLLKVDKGQVDMRAFASMKSDVVKEGGTALVRTGSERVSFPWKIVKTIRPEGWGGGRSGVAADGELVWIHYQENPQELVGLDPGSGKQKRVLKVPGVWRFSPSIAVDGTMIWALGNDAGKSELVAVDRESGREVKRVHVPGLGVYPFNVKNGVLWFWDSDNRQIVRFDLEKKEMSGRTKVEIEKEFVMARLACHDGIVYLGGMRSAGCLAVDAVDGRIISRMPPHIDGFLNGFGGMAIDPGRGLWVTTSLAGLHLVEADF
ncbi:MAG: hypothetical protein C0404_03130 [Verrucomicrobia bacterium]|nr:hypothetical protein [Verrucomicrobiota bacterium]